MTPTQKIRYWYATLDAESLEEIGAYYAPHAFFKDPFNEVEGVEHIKNIFVHMFATTENPHFVFQDLMEDQNQSFVTWYFHFSLKGKQYTINGSSHLRFNQQGLVTYHRDYWDAAEELWQKMPIIGGITKWLRTQFKVKN